MREQQPVRVLIVDDHTMVRTGLATFLEISARLELAGQAGNGREALALIERQQPDVVLMDLVMPEMDGLAATRAIRARWPDIQVIALTSFQEQEMVQGALQAGAISYLLKNVSMQELELAILSAFSGRATLSQEAVQALVSKPQEITAIQDYGLTRREHEVLELLVGGLSNPEISERLVISIGTTRTHVSNIFNKLGVSNRAEAITLALRSKLVE
ncbi:MAG: response regulator transcription factor [Anaerolineales bacterium]|nr:response regulator transcription factor [Anaerolineales bacterium]